jgi:hypothetical protein
MKIRREGKYYVFSPKRGHNVYCTTYAKAKKAVRKYK